MARVQLRTIDNSIIDGKLIVDIKGVEKLFTRGTRVRSVIETSAPTLPVYIMHQNGEISERSQTRLQAIKRQENAANLAVRFFDLVN